MEEKNYDSEFEYDENETKHFIIDLNCIEENETKKYSKGFKIFLANLFGFILAFVVQYFTILITQWLLIDVIGNIPFIPALLSWPVDYYYYALSGVMFAGIATSISTCNFFCNLVNAKFNYATIIFGIFNAIYYFIGMILTFVQSGFSFIFLLVSILTIIGYLIFGFCSENGD